MARIYVTIPDRPAAPPPAPPVTKKPVCSECLRPLTRADVRAYQAEGGIGIPDACESCAELAAADHRPFRTSP